MTLPRYFTVWYPKRLRPLASFFNRLLGVFRIPLRQHTRAGELCYEPFAGSGSQIIAAQQLGRRCNAIEISPRYCDVIIRRFIAFVGQRNNT